MKLDWQDFRLECAEGLLALLWPGFCTVEAKVDHCVSIRLVPHGPDGGAQWIFQLRAPERSVPGVIVVRADVPAAFVPRAEQCTAALRDEYGIPDHHEDTAEEEGLQRVPSGSRDWLVAPASDESQELFQDVMARIAADPG
ncbi:hypothetical protein ACFS5L_35565 [Streptomyces phyllanthi]|uniref:Uncharacterized protein n=1 Tax=Streptomyces phyllanthi TaxID=1803180 RepID=A0A5N8W4G6_9ACTN|nr:hypothetical protein [Streptomyces phyllanthi]MPY42209.1 hypothetical protein [Streptomyces phyllanthi]